MAGARPSSFKKSGGFLNNVDGVISSYEFTTEIPGGKKKAPVKGKEPFNSLFFRLDVRLDGADEDISTNLWVGSADDFEISEDGLTLTPLEETTSLRGGTAFAKFIDSLVQAGFPESNLSDSEINFESIVNTRVYFVQRIDEDATKRLGKRKGQDGKEYNRTELVVEKVLSLPGTAPTKGKAGAKGKVAAPAAKGKAGKQAAPDVSEQAGEALIRYATAAGDTGIAKGKIRMKVLTDKVFKSDTELRDAVGKWLLVDANIESVDGVVLDGDTVNIVE
jgi:hypothetical protein